MKSHDTELGSWRAQVTPARICRPREYYGRAKTYCSYMGECRYVNACFVVYCDSDEEGRRGARRRGGEPDGMMRARWVVGCEGLAQREIEIMRRRAGGFARNEIR